ncbi:MAG: flagellar M-ring protein FliF [Proteobacteria bacterium]|nr:flagellar M-ring protein FliF [Pseudomonadota bacterium]NDC23608.1 flagellar M-ring protein FliF [Pseudomonadota bacterium]NDD03786.1 flagellar M-ring protein FliF [Pseudomonadota bacterium]NDG26320.1 flagellar M-ring protein FliF [Pseudomonadota bacterium]
MNETLQRWLETAQSYFETFSRQKKILVGVTAALVVTGLVALTVMLRRDPMQVLYSELRPEETKSVSKKLSEQNVPYQVSEDGATISVPSSQVYRARMELAKEGLPGQDLVGFEKFDASTIGMSSYVQRIQYVRAVQGELTRSIQRLASVKTARVHISVPPKKTFLEEEDPPKASVVLELRAGMTPSKQETAGIAHLVASAVEGLKVNQITIVDTKGNFLHRPEDSLTPAIPSALLEMQRAIEVEYERRIEEMLTPVVGFGKVRAKVTAEIDPSRVNTTEETFDSEKAVPRSVTKMDESNSGSRPNPMGIPGSRSNLPGTEVNNPPSPVATSSNEKNSSNTTYAIPRKVQVVDKPSGSIKRLTIAVVVDGYYNKAPNATTETFAPRNEEELRRIQDLVANSVGFDSERRDSITVSSMPFNTNEIKDTDEKQTPAVTWQNLAPQMLRNGLVALVFLAFFFLVMRPFLKWMSSSESANNRNKDGTLVPRTVGEIEAAVKAASESGVQADQVAEALMAQANDASGSAGTNPEIAAQMAANDEDDNVIRGVFGDTAEKKEERQLKKLIVEQIEKSPKKSFRILQDWIEEDDEMKASEVSA